MVLMLTHGESEQVINVGGYFTPVPGPDFRGISHALTDSTLQKKEEHVHVVTFSSPPDVGVSTTCRPKPVEAGTTSGQAHRQVSRGEPHQHPTSVH